MNCLKKILSGALAFCLLTGCTSDILQESSSYETVPATTANPESSENTFPAINRTEYTVPVLSINTKNQDKNAIEFATKPVNRFVAQSIASWTPGYIVPVEPYFEDCTITLTDTDSIVLFSNVNAQVKVRGNWTTTYDKKPLRIRFEQKQVVLGLNDGTEAKNWILLAEYKDASMLRNKAALSIARELFKEDGLYAADAELVEVEINNQYWGVYLLVEQQQVNPSRINITEPEPDYTGTDIGYFLEFDGYFTNEDALHSFSVDYAGNAPLVPFDGNAGSGRTMKCLPESSNDRKKDVGITIKSDIYSEQQHDFIASYINNVYYIMYAAAYEDKAFVFDSDYSAISETTEITPWEAVEKVVDVQSLADMYIISELTCDADIYWSSFFMDVDFGEGGDGKLRFEAPWDFDSSMGNKDRCANGTGFYAANIVPDVNGGPANGGEYETINPWLAVLMYENRFQEIISEKWTSAFDSGVFDRAIEMIEHDKTQYSKAFERNYKRWNNLVNNSSFSGELSKAAAKCRTHAEAADYLSSWLRSRVDFLNDYWHK